MRQLWGLRTGATHPALLVVLSLVRELSLQFVPRRRLGGLRVICSWGRRGCVERGRAPDRPRCAGNALLGVEDVRRRRAGAPGRPPT